ncbi:SDR family oxidoreductase [Dactylosporangium sp. NPDC005572]|uniref:SDR family NAD(P)-dependent oxidoreductase n=1 Tax=Dactylosporangium sp. NPDC005572 TaxID=3156889 RepID=UPI0033B46148
MQIAIVTGASSGIGQSSAVQIARRGAGVILTYHGNQAGALETAAMIDKEGGSNAALRSGMEPGYSAYGTMKGGLVVLTRYLAKELSTRGIRVNSVSPGSTRTRIADNAFERFPEVIPGIAAKTALGRLGEPDDIGMVVAALLSAECHWITAQDVEVSGGYNL